MDGKKENPAPMHPLIPFYSNQCALCPSLPKIASSKASLSLCMYSSRSIARNRFFWSEPVAFRRVYGLESYSRTSGESNHHRPSVSNTRVPRYQLHHEDDSSIARKLQISAEGKKAARVGEAGTSSSSGDQESVMDHPIGGQLSKGAPGRSHTGPRRLLP